MTASPPRSGNRAARLAGFMLACGLLFVTANQVQHFVAAHRGTPLYVLSVFLVIPTGILGLAAAYLFEASFLGWSQSSLRALWKAPASVRLDVVCMTMTLLPYRVPGYLLSLGLLFAIDQHFEQSANISVTRFLPTWGLQAASLLLLQSFVSYWIHRLQHTVPALWALHQFHHSADRMAVITAVRETELAKGFEIGVLVICLTLLSEPVAPKPETGSALYVIVLIYIAFRAFIRVNQYLVHSNLTTDYGWIGRWLLVSPRMHRLHHATDPKYYNTNFTFDLVLWDRLFGSYAACDAETVGKLALGLNDSPFNTGPALKDVFRDYVITPYVVLWRELRRGFAAWRPMRLTSVDRTSRAASPSDLPEAHAVKYRAGAGPSP
jgi:sterol desaturase/sphingolipid hydroxylase (fatty acid hydroxylase superfamily)